jgi:hypothetical protein
MVCSAGARDRGALSCAWVVRLVAAFMGGNTGNVDNATIMHGYGLKPTLNGKHQRQNLWWFLAC